jgi:hypothetical protein
MRMSRGPAKDIGLFPSFPPRAARTTPAARLPPLRCALYSSEGGADMGGGGVDGGGGGGMWGGTIGPHPPLCMNPRCRQPECPPHRTQIAAPGPCVAASLECNGRFCSQNPAVKSPLLWVGFMSNIGLPTPLGRSAFLWEWPFLPHCRPSTCGLWVKELQLLPVPFQARQRSSWCARAARFSSAAAQFVSTLRGRRGAHRGVRSYSARGRRG